MELVFATVSSGSWYWWPLPKAAAYGTILLLAMATVTFWVWRDVQTTPTGGLAQ